MRRKTAEKTEKLGTIRTELEKTLSGYPYILRTDRLRQQLDGLSAGVMANLDSAGSGPAEKFYVGRKTAYGTQSYIDWLVARISKNRPV